MRGAISDGRPYRDNNRELAKIHAGFTDGRESIPTAWQDQQTRMLESLRNHSYCWFTTSGKRAFALWIWPKGGASLFE
jgi:hypothetical protein